MFSFKITNPSVQHITIFEVFAATGLSPSSKGSFTHKPSVRVTAVDIVGVGAGFDVGFDVVDPNLWLSFSLCFFFF